MNEDVPCADKLAFDTKAEAEAQARNLKWQSDLKLRPYKCRHCDLWHLSSNPDD